MEWNESSAAALEAALQDSLLAEQIAEAKDAGQILALLGSRGVPIPERTAQSAVTALTRLHADGLHEDDLQFLSGGCRDLGEDGLGAFIAILCMVKYRRCLF